MSNLPATCALAVTALLAGCASAGDRQHPISDGWHQATISRVDGSFDTVYPARLDCRLDDGGSGSRYVEVRYRAAHMLRHRIARLPADGPEFHVGDKVYVNVLDCLISVERRP